MKYSNYIGVGLILAFGVVAYMPWITVPAFQVSVRGMGSADPVFGEPALFNFICCTCSLVFFLTPRIWAKRANIFATTMNMAWAFKNFILLNICRQGECPDRHPGLYAMLLLSIAIFVMAILPDLPMTAASRD